MKWLVLIHVLSAIIGVGPTFFAHVLFRKNQSLEEFRHSLNIGKKLEYFPKIGGTIAVLSGLLLFFLSGSYGTFTQVWILGSLILYILIQVVVIAVISPKIGKLAGWVFNPANAGAAELPQEFKALQASASNLYYIASGLGALLFIFMILKP